MSNNWNAKLIQAAKRRYTVTLVTGQTGVIVYAPNPNKDYTGLKPPRHGDPLKCGVRLSEATPDWIAAVDPKDIIGITKP